MNAQPNLLTVGEVLAEIASALGATGHTFQSAQVRVAMTALDRIAELTAEVERLRIGHERYETVRRLSVGQFQDAYLLNRNTGKPFDEIVDDLRPFVRPPAPAQPRGAG